MFARLALECKQRLVARSLSGAVVGKECSAWPSSEDDMLTLLVVILLLIALGALPAWPYSRSWGYYPSGGLGLVVVILLVLILLGRV